MLHVAVMKSTDGARFTIRRIRTRLLSASASATRRSYMAQHDKLKTSVTMRLGLTESYCSSQWDVPWNRCWRIRYKKCLRRQLSVQNHITSNRQWVLCQQTRKRVRSSSPASSKKPTGSPIIRFFAIRVRIGRKMDILPSLGLNSLTQSTK